MVLSRRGAAGGSDQILADFSEVTKILIGFRIAPVRLNLRGKNLALVGLGSYVVNAQGDCAGCHSNPQYRGWRRPSPGTARAHRSGGAPARRTRALRPIGCAKKPHAERGGPTGRSHPRAVPGGVRGRHGLRQCPTSRARTAQRGFAAGHAVAGVQQDDRPRETRDVPVPCVRFPVCRRVRRDADDLGDPERGHTSVWVAAT